MILGAAFAEGPVVDIQKETLIPIVLDSIPNHREPPQAPQKPLTQPRTRARPFSSLLPCIYAYETGGGVIGQVNYAADTGNGYRGGAQLSWNPDPNKPSIWRSYFGERLPQNVPGAEQDAAVLAILKSDGGLTQGRWPTPYRECR